MKMTENMIETPDELKLLILNNAHVCDGQTSCFEYLSFRMKEFAMNTEIMLEMMTLMLIHRKIKRLFILRSRPRTSLPVLPD